MLPDEKHISFAATILVTEEKYFSSKIGLCHKEELETLKFKEQTFSIAWHCACPLLCPVFRLNGQNKTICAAPACPSFSLPGRVATFICFLVILSVFLQCRIKQIQTLFSLPFLVEEVALVLLAVSACYACQARCQASGEGGSAYEAWHGSWTHPRKSALLNITTVT